VSQNQVVHPPDVSLRAPSDARSANRSSSARAYVALAILTLAYVFSFVDRIVVNLLVEPMRRDLGLSDIEISLLMGFSFAVFYTVCGLPLGWLADRCDRRKLIAAGVALWSAATVACGLVRGYGALFTARLFVGAGEAALTPAAHSMIADMFPKERLGRAMSIYAMGIYVGSGLALLIGAGAIYLAELRTEWVLPLVGAVFPWQMVFVIVGLPGFAVALLVLWLREPARQSNLQALSFSETLAWARSERRFLLLHHVGFALLSLVAYAGAAWIPTAFVRSFGWTTVQAALCFGTMTVVFSVAGCIVGGIQSDRMALRFGSEKRARVGVWAAIGLLVSFAAFALVSDAISAVAILAPICFFIAMPFGAASAVLAERAPSRLRGQASALYLLAISVIGIGVGPTAVAITTEYLLNDNGLVRFAIGAVCCVASAAAAVLLNSLAQATKPIRSSSAVRAG
jgi:MFS family permease